MLKRVLAIMLVLLMVIGLFAGCGKTNDTTAEKAPEKSEATKKDESNNEEKKESKESKVIIALASDALSMDPHDYDETVTNGINLHIFDTLVANDNRLQTTTSLADSWEIKKMELLGYLT